MTEAVLEIKSLHKAYGRRVVFEEFSHRFRAGFHGVIGPNGAGKSTLLAIAGGAEPFGSGKVSLNSEALGATPDLYRPQMGYCPDRLAFYPFLSVREFWHMAANARDIEPPDETHNIVREFVLGAEIDSRLDALSLGTRKKVLLVTALMHDPLLLLLDEPTDELDAHSAAFLVDHLKSRRACITIISTHDRALLKELGADTLALEAGR